MLFGFVTPAVANPIDAVWVGDNDSIVPVCLGENDADTPTDKLTNCMSVVEDPVEESESGGESAMLERNRHLRDLNLREHLDWLPARLSTLMRFRGRIVRW